MKLVREIKRFVPRWGYFYPPKAQEVTIRLERISPCSGDYYILTPWACLNAANDAYTTDSQLEAACNPCFADEKACHEYAHQQAPHWANKNNGTIRDKMFSARHWHGCLMGDGTLADHMLITTDELHALAIGKIKATKKLAILAGSYHGLPV